MKHALLAMWLLALGCAPPFQPPTLIEREVGGKGGVTEEPIPMPSDGGEPFIELPDSGCCVVRFARAREPGELGVELISFSKALPTTTLVSLDGGDWEGTVCVGEVTVLYGYQVTLQADDPDAGEFVYVTHNPYAPWVSSSEYGQLNELDTRDAGTCDGRLSAVHGQTSADGGE